MVWKNKLSTRVQQIAVQELLPSAEHVSSLRLSVVAPQVLLLATETWEAHDVEAPFLWVEHGRPSFIYLFYSGSNTWFSSYAVGVARARCIVGCMFEKLGAPVAHTRAGFASANTTFVSPGHNSVARKGNHTYLIYHANRWNETGVNCTRRMMVDRLDFGDDDWPRLATRDGAPSDVPLPVPSANDAK